MLLGFLDPTIRTVAELEQQLGIPVVAAMPSFKKQPTRAGTIELAKDPQSKTSEAIRTLRTGLTFLARRKNAVLSLSPVPCPERARAGSPRTSPSPSRSRETAPSLSTPTCAAPCSGRSSATRGTPRGFRTNSRSARRSRTFFSGRRLLRIYSSCPPGVGRPTRPNFSPASRWVP